MDPQPEKSLPKKTQPEMSQPTKSQHETLRNQLLDAAAKRSPRYTQYRHEVNTMLADLETRVRIERRMVIAQWLFIVVLTTAFMLIGGYHIDKSTAGLWFGILGVFWFLFGAVFLLSF